MLFAFSHSPCTTQITWKIVVSHELRALVYKCLRTNQYCLRVFSPPYPPEDYGQLIFEEVVPDVVLEGDYDNMSMRCGRGGDFLLLTRCTAASFFMTARMCLQRWRGQQIFRTGESRCVVEPSFLSSLSHSRSSKGSGWRLLVQVTTDVEDRRVTLQTRLQQMLMLPLFF